MAKEEQASLAHTPTWVVAAVCLAIVSVSLVAERFLHHLGKLLKHKKQKALVSALNRLKEELMLLGFISFVLSLSQGFIVDICIPETATHFMLPCKKEIRRAPEENAKHCTKKGDVPLLSLEALHQLHIFIFVLGLVHVVFCATTILLGGAKMRGWKQWEKEIHHEIENLPKTEFERKTTPLSGVLHRDHQGNFFRDRTKGVWMKLAVVSWTIAFLKQFHDSVSKSDYVALRSAFVLNHTPGRLNFDFHKYMMRALEHDFKRVVGISWYLWLFVIIFLLLNINGWHTYFWLAFLPLFLLLIVGAKLEHIITRLAQDAKLSLDATLSLAQDAKLSLAQDANLSLAQDAKLSLAQDANLSLANETERAPRLKPSKEHFWFGRPGLILHLIHFILFQNSFEIGFFFWVVVPEGFGSCMMERKAFAITRLVLGVIIEIICSYVTLPLYAIVTHMAGDIKLEGIASGLHETIESWATSVHGRQTGDDTGPNTGTAEVDVSREPNERFGSSRSMLSPTPGLDEIVTVDDGGQPRREVKGQTRAG